MIIDDLCEDYGDLKIKIGIDEYGQDFSNPRDWMNLGTMVCWHPNYELGDEQIERNSQTIEERVRDLTDEGVVILPLYLMDHSGISMSTSDQMFKACDSEGWDWGQVGFIYCETDKAKKELQETDPAIANSRAKENLISEVEVYDSFLRGEIYYYSIEDEYGEQLDACGGFVGDSDYVLEEAREMAEYCAEKIKEETRKAHDWACRDVVTVQSIERAQKCCPLYGLMYNRRESKMTLMFIKVQGQGYDPYVHVEDSEPDPETEEREDNG